jgi:hypothetical protein
MAYTVNLSGPSDTLGDYNLGANVSITGIGVPWSNTTISDDTYTLNAGWNTGRSGKLKLEGDSADIEINGESLMGMIKSIEQRLNILKPNEALESEWEELRTLGDQYRTLEAQIQAKMKTWNAIAK